MNKYDLSDTFDLVERFQACRDVSAVHKLTLDLTRPEGVEYVFSGIIPEQGLSAKEQLASVLFGSWPEEWLGRYFQKSYLERDPTIAHIRKYDTSLSWRRLDAYPSLVMQEARDFGLKDGMTIPMISLSGIRMGTSFGGVRLSDDPTLNPRLQVIAALATARSMELVSENTSPRVAPHNLSPAEVRALNWIAEGKTNWEISTILGVSEKTIEKHARNAMRKLEAVNRTQLVTRAMRIGLLI